MNGHRPKPINMGVANELIQTYLGSSEAAASETPVGSDPLARVRAMAEKSGKPEQAAKLVEIFVRSNDGVVERLGAALLASDQAAALAQLHRLKGSAGSFGAEEFGQQTTSLEEKVLADGLNGNSAGVQALIEDWKKLRAVLLDGVA
jgi:HPt (histidine-containing phosphotransfer) domain-containing protein